MSLVWHIVKKDLRRMWLGVSFWCAFVAAVTIGFAVSAGALRTTQEAEIDAWLTHMRLTMPLLVVGQLVVAYLLAGAMALEDPLVGADAFWPTRPIANARLLAAKVLAAVLLFMVAPTVALVPVWLASGFTLRETWSAATELALPQGVGTLLALVLAGLARNLAQFLFGTIALGVAYVGCAYLGALIESATSAAIYRARATAIFDGELAVLVLVLVLQFLTRRTARAWLIIGVALAASLVARVAWPWEVSTPRTAPAHSNEQPADRAARIEVEPSLATFTRNLNEAPHARVTAPWTRDGFYAPISVRLADGSVAFEVRSGWNAAGLRALGFDGGDGPLDWLLEWELATNRASAERAGPRGEAHATGELEVWFTHARILGELPLEEGAELANGSSRARIVGIARDGKRLDGIFLEECTAQPVDDAPGGAMRSMFGAGGHVDQYYLVDRAAHRAQPLGPHGRMGSLDVHSLRVTFSRLFVPGTDEWNGAVLVKVRFERERTSWRPFEVRGLVNER